MRELTSISDSDLHTKQFLFGKKKKLKGYVCMGELCSAKGKRKQSCRCEKLDDMLADQSILDIFEEVSSSFVHTSHIWV